MIKYSIKTITDITLAMAVVGVSGAPGASAQEGYPARPIRIVAPTSPGGANDVLARMLGVRMTQH